MENHSENNAKNWIRSELRELHAYHVPNASGMIKLDAMENPFVWTDELRSEWADLLAKTDVNRYPDPTAHSLKQSLRESMQIPNDMQVMLGNGSDEIIQIIAMAMSGVGRCILSVEPGFVMYRMIATFCGMKYVGVPLSDQDFSLDMPALLQAMDQHQPAVVFLAFPNNPTGNLFDADEVKKVIEAAPGLVVVDEAYAPFTDESFMPLLGQYDNLVVMRTVSKMGLAGLRLGLLAGPAQWLDEFEKLRLPYNINTLTQKSAEFALKHQVLFDEQTQVIRQQRTWLKNKLEQIADLKVYPSQANFILLRLPENKPASQLHSALKEKGILVKNQDNAAPALKNCLRITVGSEEENRAFVDAFRALMK